LRDVRDALMVARNTDGKLIRRPLSPHLQVYRWPISMAMSITHRVTGVGLGVGTLLLTWWLVAAAISDDAFATVQWFLATPIGLLLLFGWTLALFFHLFAGIRHLVWDAGYGFEQPWYDRSAWAVLLATGVATLLLWIVGFVVW
jgi:succinate dehydrogenase / fumarate reductase cytochrome b subunit